MPPASDKRKSTPATGRPTTRSKRSRTENEDAPDSSTVRSETIVGQEEDGVFADSDTVSTTADGETAIEDDYVLPSAPGAAPSAPTTSQSRTKVAKVPTDALPEDREALQYPMIRALMNKIRPLPYVRSVTNYGASTPATYIPIVSIQAAFAETPRRKRLDALSTFPGTPHFINLALANPVMFVKRGQFVALKDDVNHAAATFFMLGTVSECRVINFSVAKQICFTPFNCLWPRSAAVLGSILRCKKLYVQTFNKGITISTARQKSSTDASSSSPVKSPRRVKKQKMKAVLWPEDEVPLYDGRKAFTIGKYRELNQIDYDITPNSAVIAIFTVGTFPLAESKRPTDETSIEDSLSFNIQSVVLLEEQLSTAPGDDFDEDEVWGTYPQEQAEDEDEADEEYLSEEGYDVIM
ncbi:hypothetical protein DENSPDRAFT_880176 [Dentipellis sp. KUC8613]|nr:hypothetical protein DENSPDRAFT_880176 [Dentipellis sp. KUC8613]